MNALLPKLLLEADVKVRDHEEVPGEEGGAVRDRLQVHGRTKGIAALTLPRSRRAPGKTL
jgi:hypothetical protein